MNLKKVIFTGILVGLVLVGKTQRFYEETHEATRWVDSVYNSLTKKERIAQLIVVRLSERTPNGVIFYTKKVDSLVRKYNIGSICLFQGGPTYQANILNQLQTIAKTPILVCIDGETGVGMRMTDSVMKIPDQLTMGAVRHDTLIFEAGRLIGRQCKRMGIHVNYAPVVDINNNAANPVIGVRSFGEDKYKVAQFSIAIVNGMQSEGVMACAKHFPGHGDVSVDSHLDLPVINKTRPQLDSLELYPFREVFEKQVASVMVAHLSIPAIDKTPHRPTTLSSENVTDLLRGQLHFNGISFTDGLEMKGVTKYYSNGEIAVQSLMAGNDMLCLPQNIPDAIESVWKALKKGRIKEEDIEKKVRKVLLAKYHVGLHKSAPVSLTDLTADLNEGIPALRQKIAKSALTVLNWQPDSTYSLSGKKIAYLLIGQNTDNTISSSLHQLYGAEVFYLDYKTPQTVLNTLLANLNNNYDVVVAGLHKYRGSPSSNFGLSNSVAEFLKQLEKQQFTMCMAFGNPYALKLLSGMRNLVCCYEDDIIFQQAATDWLIGRFTSDGTLPVSIDATRKVGTGQKISLAGTEELRRGPKTLSNLCQQRIDSIVNNAIQRYATPGCAVMVAKNSQIIYHKTFGNYTYEGLKTVDEQSVYDLASITKVAATTLAVMKLFEEGKLELSRPMVHYLPWLTGSNKAYITIRDLLLHQGGMVAYIPFYKETQDPFKKAALPGIFENKKDSLYGIELAGNMYLRNDWLDTIKHRIIYSAVSGNPGYVYSDNDFIFLGWIVESITGMPLDQYLSEAFYTPMELASMHFTPLKYLPVAHIVPTEWEMSFRRQLIQGYVHDPGAAMLGGVAGHAGLFSNAEDLATVFMMLLNGGYWQGHRYLTKETIELFTSYQSAISRRGLGFDKPEKDNQKRTEPYPAASCSPGVFGHTGFTGTCVWADPHEELVFVFLSNRVYPNGGGNTMLNRLNIRGKLLELVYQDLKSAKPDE
jgi:beta-glucosidase-like glycosyl hydrolase/CubicO group peptidase (beta-lactamase class C family)